MARRRVAKRVRPSLVMVLLVVLLAVAAPAAAVSSGPAASSQRAPLTTVQAVCPVVPAGRVRCLAWVRTDRLARSEHPAARWKVEPSTGIGDNGAYDPAYLQSAYGVYEAIGGSGTTIAVVDAYDDPTAASDLSYYRSYFDLPPCTVASGCFTKVDEHGGSDYPVSSTQWAMEESTDLDMVSAMCPSCHILLVEAASDEMTDVGPAENTAVALGAAVVTNSFGSAEYAGETADDANYFDHPGAAIVAASGDSGYGVEFPAASPHVVAVGGTTLDQTSDTGSRDATETAWDGSGSGCSAYEPKPTWQSDTGCSNRSVADVSAVADPATGVWVYDTTGENGFVIIGGTSVAAPIVAAVYGLAGNPAPNANPGEYPYNAVADIGPSVVNDITSGSNGTCSPSYLCTAGPGYDGPTGLGTPNGLAAFSEYALTTSAQPAPPETYLTYQAEANTPGQTATVTFTADGDTSSDCTGIALDSQGGAFCSVALATDGSYPVTATFSNGSQTLATATLTQVIQGSDPLPVDFARCDGPCPG